MLRYFSGILLISFLDRVKPGLDFLPKVIATAPCGTVSFVDAGERSALSVSSVTESAASFRTFAVSASFASPYRSTVLICFTIKLTVGLYPTASRQSKFCGRLAYTRRRARMLVSPYPEKFFDTFREGAAWIYRSAGVVSYHISV